jgi:hypothetical protein
MRHAQQAPPHRSTAPLRRLMLQSRRDALLSTSTLDQFGYTELVDGAAAVCGAPLPAPPRFAVGFPACVAPGALVAGEGAAPLFVRPLPTGAAAAAAADGAGALAAARGAAARGAAARGAAAEEVLEVQALFGDGRVYEGQWYCAEWRGGGGGGGGGGAAAAAALPREVTSAQLSRGFAHGRGVEVRVWHEQLGGGSGGDARGGGSGGSGGGVGCGGASSVILMFPVCIFIYKSPNIVHKYSI